MKSPNRSRSAGAQAPGRPGGAGPPKIPAPAARRPPPCACRARGRGITSQGDHGRQVSGAVRAQPPRAAPCAPPHFSPRACGISPACARGRAAGQGGAATTRAPMSQHPWAGRSGPARRSPTPCAQRLDRAAHLCRGPRAPHSLLPWELPSQRTPAGARRHAACRKGRRAHYWQRAAWAAAADTTLRGRPADAHVDGSSCDRDTTAPTCEAWHLARWGRVGK